jgi:hypothetical protein
MRCVIRGRKHLGLGGEYCSLLKLKLLLILSRLLAVRLSRQRNRVLRRGSHLRFIGIDRCSCRSRPLRWVSGQRVLQSCELKVNGSHVPPLANSPLSARGDESGTCADSAQREIPVTLRRILKRL